MIVGYGVAQRSEAGGEVIELAVMAGNDIAQPGYHSVQCAYSPAQPGYLGREIVEFAVMPCHRARNLRQQLVDGCNIGPVCTTHAKTVAAVMPRGQALHAPRLPDL